MSWKLVSVRVHLLRAALVVGSVILFYLVIGFGFRSVIMQEFLGRQQMVARAEASNIASFFETFGDSIAVLSQLKSITSPDSAIWEMDVFVEQWRESGVVGGVALTDRRGIVRLNSNVSGTHDTGTSLSDRDYFIWARGEPEAGEFFIGKPVVSRLGASKDQIIVPVAAPVYQNGVFEGVVASSVKLAPLTQHFLGLMKVSDLTDVYLINEKGEILYGDSELLPKLKSLAGKKGEGSLRSKGSLISYSPVSLGGQSWLVVMVSSTAEAGNLVMPLYMKILVLLFLVILTAAVFDVAAFRLVKKRR